MKTIVLMLVILTAVVATGCVQPKAIEVLPQAAADIPVLSPQGNAIASPAVASGNTVPITAPTNVVTSQPADQRGTLTGGQAEAGHDQANRVTNVNIPVNVSGGGWAAVGALGLLVVGGVAVLVLLIKLRSDHRQFASDVRRRLRPEWSAN